MYFTLDVFIIRLGVVNFNYPMTEARLGSPPTSIFAANGLGVVASYVTCSSVRERSTCYATGKPDVAAGGVGPQPYGRWSR
jgi:hypothetical protein